MDMRLGGAVMAAGSAPLAASKTAKARALRAFWGLRRLASVGGGEGGIRTLDTLFAYTRFPGVLLQPLGHLSGVLGAAGGACRVACMTRCMQAAKIKPECTRIQSRGALGP